MALKHEIQFKLSLFIVGKQYLRSRRAVSASRNVNITTVHDSSRIRDSAPAVWQDCSKLAIFVTSSLLRASFVRQSARNFSQMHNFDAPTAFHRNHLRRFRRAFGYVRRRDYRRFMTRRESPPRKTPESALIRVVAPTGSQVRSHSTDLN